MSEKVQAQITAIKQGLKSTYERLEEIDKNYAELPENVKAEMDLSDLKIDLHVLEHDESWRSWKKDEQGTCSFPVEEGKAGWIRISKAGNEVLVLVKAMKKRELKQVCLGFFKYTISGDFLQRKPLSQPDECVTEAPMQATKTERTVDDVKLLFPKDLEEMLMFEEMKDDIIIKPRQFLGSENFAKIASIVRDAAGEYISAGKESHFRIPLKA